MARIIPGGLVGPTPGQYQQETSKQLQQAVQFGMQYAYQQQALAEQKRQAMYQEAWNTIQKLAQETPSGTVSELFANNPSLGFTFLKTMGLDDKTANNIYKSVTSQPMSADAFMNVLAAAKVKRAVMQVMGIPEEQADEYTKTVMHSNGTEKTTETPVEPVQKDKAGLKKKEEEKKQEPQRTITNQDFYQPQLVTPNQLISNTPPTQTFQQTYGPNRPVVVGPQEKVQAQNEGYLRQKASESIANAPQPEATPYQQVQGGGQPTTTSTESDKSIGYLAMQKVFENHPELHRKMPAYQENPDIWKEFSQYQMNIQKQYGLPQTASWDNTPLSSLKKPEATKQETTKLVPTPKATTDPEVAKEVAEKNYHWRDIPGSIAKAKFGTLQKLEKTMNDLNKLLQSGKTEKPAKVRQVTTKAMDFVKQDIRYKDVKKMLTDPAVVRQMAAYSDMATQDPNLLSSLLARTPEGQAVLLQRADQIEAMKDPAQRQLALAELQAKLYSAYAKIYQADADMRIADSRVQEALKGNDTAKLNYKIKLMEVALQQDKALMNTLQTSLNLMSQKDLNMQKIGANMFNGLDTFLFQKFGVHLNAYLAKDPALWNLFGVFGKETIHIQEGQHEAQTVPKESDLSDTAKSILKDTGVTTK